MKLIGIDVLIHWNGKDVLLRCLIVRREIEGIICLQVIPLPGKFIAIVNAGFPGIQLLAAVRTRLAAIEQRSSIGSLHHEIDILALRSLRIPLGPVIKHVDLGIQRQFCQQKVNHRLRDAAIVIALLVAMLIGKIRQHLLQLAENEVEHLAPLALRRKSCSCDRRKSGISSPSIRIKGSFSRRQNHRNPAKHIHRLVIHQCP